MKKSIIAASIFTICIISRQGYAQLGSILGTVQSTVEQKVDEKAQQKTAEAMDSALNNGSPQQPGGANNSSTSVSKPVSAPQTIAAYQNYDFKPGEQIIFEDHFTDDQDGEFPAHWDLEKGQGVVNKVNGEPTFLLTEGNYVVVSPRMKTESYLTDRFTVEFDYYQANSSQYPPIIMFHEADKSASDHLINFGHSVNTTYFQPDLSGNDVGTDEEYFGKWHHAAIIYKNGQMKAYLDNTRALVAPHCGFVPASLSIGGIGEQDAPITLRNVRIASGGGANTIGNILTNGKFVTHGITFDVARATLKPESMGVLNEVANFLKSNANVGMEIDGHTDSDGPADKNVKLSQDRADAVKTQLIAMGVDGSRLATRGFGAMKPIASNDSPEGKANNRRVEFIKM